MEQFLTSLKQDQEKLLQCSEVKVVLGNEACDLDSAVSAIVYAYYLSKKYPETCVIPVLNIPASDFRLRTESTHFFKKLNILTECLRFRDQINFKRLSYDGKLKLYLVDHNVLTGSDVIYENCVTSVIDHHVRECPEREGVRVKLDFVGSCCTLIAEELLDDPEFELDEVVAELLYGTILVDTINRSPEAGKITPRDQDVLDKLHTVIPNVKGDNLYQELQTAKFNLKDLLNMEILEKDLKMVPGSGMTIAMSSVTMEMEELLRRPNFQADLAEFSEKKGADVVVIMTLTMDANDKPTRQIAIYSPNRIYKDQIADVLDNSAEENLELDPCFPPFESISVFRQGNVKASRKKVMPILKSFLQGDTTPDVTSKEFVTQQSVSMAAEGFSSFSNLLEPGQKVEGESSGNDCVNSASSALLDLESLDPFGKEYSAKNDSNMPEMAVETESALLGKRRDEFNANATCVKPEIAFDIFATQNEDPETGSFSRNESENFSKSDNPFADFSSTNLSSVNSSNLFDFITSDSELVDPFSSIEDTQPSLPNPTDISDNKESTKYEKEEVTIIENQSLGDKSIDNQTVPLAQTSATQGSNTNPFFYIPDDSAQPYLLSNEMDSGNSSTNISVEKRNNSNTNTNNILNDSKISSVNPFEDDFNKTGSTGQVVNPFELPLSSEQFLSESNNVELGTGFKDFTNIAGNIDIDRNPFQGKNPFDLPLDVSIANESHFEDMTNEENPPNMDYLDIDSDQKGSRPRARKSISLIVEVDQHSSEKLDELDEADFFDKVATPEIQHSGETSPFVNSGVLTPFEGVITPNTEGLSLAGSGYPSISAPPNSVMEGSGFETRDHDLPSFNSAEMVERIHRKKASLGNIADFDGIDIQGKSSVPYTPQNSFRDDVPSPSVNLILPEMETSQMEHTIQEKRNSLVAAQSFTSGEDDLLGLSFGTEKTLEADVMLDKTSETEKHSDVNENPVIVGNNTQNSNLFHTLIDPVSVSNDVSDLVTASVDPFTPTNSYVDSLGASLLEGRQSVPDIELFDRLNDLQKQRTDSTSHSDKGTDIEYTQSVNKNKTDDVDVNNFDPFFKESNILDDTQTAVDFDPFDLTLKSNFVEGIVIDKVDNTEPLSVTKNMVQQDPLIDIPVESTNTSLIFTPNSNFSKVSNSREEILKESQGLDSKFQMEMLEKAEHDVVQDVSNIVTCEVMKQAIDDFPDMSNPAVAESVALEILHGDTNSDWTDQGSGDSGIGSSDSTQQGINKAPRSPRRTNVTQYSLETDYLPSMDPLHGNLNIVMSPSSTTQSVETDAGKEVVESESFRRISFEAGPETSEEHAVCKSPENLADTSENSVKDMILCQNLENSQDYDIPVSDLSRQPNINSEVFAMSQEDRGEITVSSSNKMESDRVEDSFVVENSQDCIVPVSDLSSQSDIKDKAFTLSEEDRDDIPISSSDRVELDIAEDSSNTELIPREPPKHKDLYDINILKDSESMIDEEEIVSSPGDCNDDVQDILTANSTVNEIFDHDSKEFSNKTFKENLEHISGENNEIVGIENDESIPEPSEEQVIPPSDLSLEKSSTSEFFSLEPVEINIEACSISPDSSKSYNSSSDSEVDLITVRENIMDSSPTDIVEQLDECNANNDTRDINLSAGINDIIENDQSVLDENDDILEKEAVPEAIAEDNTCFKEQKLPDLILESKAANSNSTDVNLLESIEAGDQLAESTLTIETISPVETPENEHATGFYEVNPEFNPYVTNMERSLNTNLGDNVTGFYEVNAENSKMTESILTQESASPVETSMEEHSTGFYEINAESVTVDKTPEISVSMTKSFETETSDVEGNTGFYEMNSEIQGTVLQNIEIGDAFSPAESPNDEVIGISYQINPMIPDLLTESNFEIEENNKSEISVFESYNNTKTDFDEEVNNTEAILLSMADGLVSEAIKGAFETVYEIKGQEEVDVVKEIADAMIEDDRSLESSEESDVSSTTTEGSYRINCSPVMTPDSETVLEEQVKRMKNNEVYVIEESANEDLDYDSELDKTAMTKDCHSKILSEQSEKPLLDNEKEDENMILPDTSLPNISENTRDKAEAAMTSETSENADEDISSAKNLVRQETVIPDIIISEDGNGDANESDTCSEKDTKAVIKDMEQTVGKSDSITSVEQAIAVDEEIAKEKEDGVLSSNNIKSDSIEGNVETMKSVYDEIAEKEVALNDEGVDMSNTCKMEENSSRKIDNTSASSDKNINISNKEESSVSITKSRFAEQEYTTRKEIFYTTAGRMSVSIDSVVDPPGLTDHVTHGRCQNPISEETMQVQIAYLLAQIKETTGQADEILSELCQSNLTSIKEIHGYLIEKLDIENSSVCAQPGDDDFDPLDLKDDQAVTETTHTQQQQPQQQQGVQKQQKTQEDQQGAKVKSNKKKSDGKVKGMEDTQEWHEDPIPGMGVQDDDLDSSESESESDSDSEYGKPARPDSLLSGKRRKKKILANSNIVTNDSTDDLVEGVDDLPTPDDLETPDDMEGELEWEDDTPITPSSEKKFSDYIHTRDDGDDDEDDKEYEQNTGMRKVEIAGKDYKVDMHVIEPYKKVLSHGGYYGDGLNAIILFCGCYLPDRSRRDYQYVMDNLFLYVISTLELLVAEDYMIVYFHGATPRRQMPSFGWLKRCYQMIDRRLRKNLKALLMVHPTLWLKTVVMMTKPFISSKFSSKLRFVKTLQELGKIVPMEYIYVPEPVQQYDTKLKQQRASANNTPVTPISPS